MKVAFVMKSIHRLCFLVPVVLFAVSAPVLAQTGPQLLLKEFPKELRLDMNVDASLTQDGHAKRTDQSLQIGIVDVEGRIRLTPGELESPRIGFGLKYFDVNSSVRGLPGHLYDQSVGFATPVGKWEDWILGVSVGVGYSGNAPFGDGNGWYGKAGIVAFKQLDKTSALAIAIDYDGNRTIAPDVPLPGFAYIKRIQSNLSLTVGLPVTSIEWEPVQDLRVELSYLLLENFSARVGYRLGEGFELFGAIGQRSDAFSLDGQRYGDDRLLFQQRHAELGVTYRTRDAGVGDQDLELTAAIGYAFDGEFSVGFDTRNSRLLADVSDEPYLRLALQLRF